MIVFGVTVVVTECCYYWVPDFFRLEKNLDSRLAKGGAYVVIALFTVTLGDYLILAQLGVRLLPLDYETLEVAFFVLAALTALVGVLVYRRPREAREGLFRSEIAGHRIVLAFCVFPMAATVVGFFGQISWFVDLFANSRLHGLGAGACSRSMDGSAYLVGSLPAGARRRFLSSRGERARRPLPRSQGLFGM